MFTLRGICMTRHVELHFLIWQTSFVTVFYRLKKKMKSTCSLMRIMFRTGRRNDCKCWLVFQSICYLLNESKINYFIQCVQYMIQCLFQGLQYRKKTVWEQKLWWLFHWLRKYRPLGEYPENKQRTNIKRVFREKPKRLFFLQWNSAN